MPAPFRARVLWLGVRQGADDLEQLALRCRRAISRAGIEVEGGRFRGHLTVARANGISATAWLRILDTLPEASWRVRQIELIRSLGLAGGAGYRTLARFELMGTRQ